MRQHQLRRHLLREPWELRDTAWDARLLYFLMACALMLALLILGLVRVHDKHKARAASGEPGFCYQGVGDC